MLRSQRLIDLLMPQDEYEEKDLRVIANRISSDRLYEFLCDIIEREISVGREEEDHGRTRVRDM